MISLICNEWKWSTPHGERFRQWDNAAPLCNYDSYDNNYFMGALINNANNREITDESKIIQIISSEKNNSKNRREKST